MLVLSQVGAAYNLSYIIVYEPTQQEGLLYFLGAFLPIMILWMDKTFYDRYAETSYGNVQQTLPHLVPHLKRDQAQTWAGFRPVTYDGKPFIGASKVENLYVNGGLGHMGWTMSHGAARITADLIGGKTPAIDLTGMTLQAQRS